MSESEEEIFLTQSSFNGSRNPDNDLDNLISSESLEEYFENAHFSIEEATEGLFSLDEADKHEEVSTGSVDKDTETNKKMSKRGIIVIDDKELLARNSERVPRNTSLRSWRYFWGYKARTSKPRQ